MKALENPPMRTVVSQLMEHSNWASESWVEATMSAIGEAVRETADRATVARLHDAEAAGDMAEREQVLLAALEAIGDGHELRTLGLRFMRLRNQFRPIWSVETTVR